MTGLTERVNNNGWRVIRLHYSADPKKRITGEDAKLLLKKKLDSDLEGMADLAERILCDPHASEGDKWFAEIQKTMTCKQWRQEMEIDWSVFDGRPVFPTFRYNLHVGKPKADLACDFPLLVMLDFGFHHPAMLITQYDGVALKILEEWAPVSPEVAGEITTDEFALGVYARLEKYIAQGFKVLFYSGLESIQVNKQTGLNDAQVFAGYNMKVRLIPKSSIPRRLHIIRMLLQAYSDGTYGLIVHERCPETIRGFQGAYRFREKQDNRPYDERPLKDGYYDNIFDALGYGAEQCFDTQGRYYFTSEQTQMLAAGLAKQNPFEPKSIYIHPRLQDRPGSGTRSGRLMRNG